MVEAGALQRGKIMSTHVTLNTETGEWVVIGFETVSIG